MPRHPEQRFVSIPGRSPLSDTWVKSQKEIKAPNTVDAFLNQLRGYKILTRAEEQKLFRELIAAREAGNDRLYRHKRELVVRHNGRLAMAVAKKYRLVALRFGMDMNDLLQIALEGLAKAIDKFDPERGNKFSTMAIWWIRQQVTRAIHDGDVIRKPVHYCEKFSKILSHAKKLHGRLNRMPTLEEICESLYQDEVAVKRFVNRDNPEITPDLIRSVCSHFTRTHSLNHIINRDDGETELMDFIADSYCESPDEYAEKLEIREAIAAALNDPRLTDEQRQFLKLYYGIETGIPMRFSDVADAMGITRHRARTIKGQAERKMSRNAFQNQYGLKALLEAS